MNRRSRILLGAFVALAAVVMLVRAWPDGRGGAELRIPGWAPGSKGDKADEDAPFDSIAIAADGQSVVLSRGADRRWTMDRPAGARPDRYKVRQIAELLRDDLVSVLPATPREDDLKAFGMDDASRVTVTFRKADGSTTAIDIGSWQKPEGGATGDGDTFVRAAGDPRVWRVLGRNLRKPFDGGPKGLRDRKPFAFDAADVTAIRIRDAAAPDAVDRDILLVSDAASAGEAKEGEAPRKPERNWRFEQPSGLPAGDVKAFLSSLAGLYVQEYVDAPTDGTSVPDDAYSVRLDLADGGSAGLRVAPGKGDAAWLQVDGIPGFARVAKYVLDQVRKHTGDLRDRRLFGIARGDIRAVEIADGERRLALELSGNRWVASVPSGLPVSRSAVESLLGDIEGLRADGFAAPSSLAGVRTGLDRPVATIAVVRGDGGRRVLRIGADKGSGARWVQIDGSGDIATLPAWSLARVRKSPDDVRNKTFFDVSPATLRRIEIAYPDQQVVLERQAAASEPDEAWRIVSPTGTAGTKKDVVATLVGTVAGFSAKSFATGPDARRAVSGRPEFTVTAIEDGGARHVLKVFAPATKDGDPYATADGEPGFRGAVLLLNAWQVRNVQKRAADLAK